MAINTTGITPLANHLPTMWADELDEACQDNVGLSGLVDRRHDDTMRFGRVLTVTNRSNPAVRIKTEDTSATWANITEENQTLTISRQAYAGWVIEDIADIQSKYEDRAGYTEAAGYSMVAFLEGDLTSGLASLPASYSALGGSLGTPPGDDDLLAAKTALDKFGVPESDRYAWVTPGFYNTLLSIDKFMRADAYNAPNDAVKQGRTNKRIYGFDMYVSNLAYGTVSSGLTNGQSYNSFCHKKGVVLVVQRQPTVHTQYLINEFGWGVMIDMIYNFLERRLPPTTLGGGTATDQFNYAIRAN